MIDIEQFQTAVNDAKTKFNLNPEPVDLEDKTDLQIARMDWLVARDILAVVEVTLDTANAQHLANDFRQRAIEHVGMMRRYGPSPSTNAILDLYAPLLDVIYNTNTEVINVMPPLPDAAPGVIPAEIP